MPTEYANNTGNMAAFTGLALRQPIWLVHGGDGSEGGDDASEGGESEVPDSAARALAPTAAWSAIGGVLAAWGVGMVAGVGLLAAW